VENLAELLGNEYFLLRMDRRGNIIYSSPPSEKTFMDLLKPDSTREGAKLLYEAISNGKSEGFLIIDKEKYFFRFLLKDDEIWGMGRKIEEEEPSFKTDFMGNVIYASPSWEWVNGKNLFDIMENEEKLMAIISKAIERGEIEERGEINGRKVIIKIRVNRYLEFFIKNDIGEMVSRVAESKNIKEMVKNICEFLETLSYRNYEVKIENERVVKEGEGEYFTINVENGYVKIYGKMKKDIELISPAISIAYRGMEKEILLENIPFCMVDESGKILSCNKKFLEITGYGEEIEGMDINEISPHKKFSDGIRKWKGKYGEKWFRERCIRANNKIFILLDEFTSEKEKIDENEFLNSILRHDIFNKNQIALGYIGLLEKTKLTKKQKEYLAKAKTGIEESNRLIKSVRDLNEIKKERKFKKIRIGKILKEVCDSFEKDAKMHGMKIECNVRNFVITADDLIGEVFSNIIRNAIEHSQGKLLKIYTRSDGKMLEIVFEDDGIGIPKEFLENVFKQGWKHNSRGSGLGMYIVKKLMERCGGKVIIESEEGKGTKVILQFGKDRKEEFLKIRL